MRKSAATPVLLCVLFLACHKRVDASLITIRKTGEVVVNILSAENDNIEISQAESITVSKSSIEMGEIDMPISLFRKDGKHLLNVAGKNGEKSFDVTGYQDRILEIEERPSVKKIAISLASDQFVIEQSGIKARTPYQINVEPNRSRITILTPTGYKFLTLLPSDAVNVLLRTNAISALGSDRTVDISEDEKGNLYYDISGTKEVGIKSLYTFNAPVSAKISVITGEVMELNQPVWLKILSLFTLQT